MTDLILWRHGQTDYNLQGRIQGRVDIPLNGTGREQARRAADIIAVLKPTRIVSSPLVRARATAETLASLIGQSVEVDSALAEKSFGDWEGLKADDIKAQWPPGAPVAIFPSSGSRGVARPPSEWARHSRPSSQGPARMTSS